MRFGQSLFELYADWKRWTEIESEAIRHGEWQRVEECQQKKNELKARIVEATGALEANSGPAFRTDLERELRRVIGELIGLEARNSELLAARRQQAELEQKELDRTSQNLRQLHRAYAPGPRQGWQRYS
ncbi:MAG: hypothetical protein AB1813_13590 [Verrucomicrobiota bacterium]|jgi:hypothetical protein